MENHIFANKREITFNILTGHCERNKMVEVSVGGGGKFQSSEANVIQGLVVNAISFIGVLDQLVNGKGGVVGLDDGIGHFG